MMEIGQKHEEKHNQFINEKLIIRGFDEIMNKPFLSKINNNHLGILLTTFYLNEESLLQNSIISLIRRICS